MPPALTFETSSLLHSEDNKGEGSTPCQCQPSSRVVIVASTVAFLGILAALSYSYSETAADLQSSSQDHESIQLDQDGKVRDRCTDHHQSLTMAHELPFESLFKDTKGQKKFEASSVIIQDGFAYAVCDSSWSISKFGLDLMPLGEQNLQIGDPDAHKKDDSEYEALFYDDGSFYVVRESIKHIDESYHAVIEQLKLGDTDYDVIQKCPTEFEFEGASKGFEGAMTVRDTSGRLTVIGLCEGNHCSESRKKDKGNGQMVVMQKKEDEKECSWETIRTINIPSSAYFEDYSDIAMDSNGRVAMSSQEEAQLWVGQLLGQSENGEWDIEQMDFDPNIGQVFDFPKNDKCKTVYCNIEGVHWISNDMIMAVSDKMKKGKQNSRCSEKDQSVHIFVVPGQNE